MQTSFSTVRVPAGGDAGPSGGTSGVSVGETSNTVKSVATESLFIIFGSDPLVLPSSAMPGLCDASLSETLAEHLP